MFVGLDVLMPSCLQGTYYFMAIELLILGSLLHEVHHDLQSIYWVLLWVVLRHTDHSLGQKYCTLIFKYGNDFEARNVKFGWLGADLMPQSEQLIIKDNEPLTTMMEKLRTMVRRSVHRVKLLTYDSVLEVFNEALEKDGWPANDRVECTLDDPVVSPCQSSPHVASAPPALPGAQFILPASRDSAARGKGNGGEATNVGQVEQASRKRKDRSDSGTQVEGLESETALRERSPDAKRRRGIPGPS